MGTRESQLFFRQSGAAPIGIIATEGAKELAQRIDSYLIKWAREAGIEKEFLNDELDVCIAELKEYILHEMRKRI